MPWCPNCREEYISGIQSCGECGTQLVSDLPTDEAVAPAESCFLMTVSDQLQAQLLEGLLSQADIPFFTKDKVSGDFMKVLSGYSLYGTDIYIDKRDYEKAKELVDAFFAQPEASDEADLVPPEEYSDKSAQGEEPKRHSTAETAIKLILILFLLWLFLRYAPQLFGF